MFKNESKIHNTEVYNHEHAISEKMKIKIQKFIIGKEVILISENNNIVILRKF
jgi:hypothetical protein